MRSISHKKLIKQAKEFFKETGYIPSNYDAIFHTNHFSSPVTIRKHFGSWDNYIYQSFVDSMLLEYDNKMFYGGYNIHYSITLPEVMELHIYTDVTSIDILDETAYNLLHSREVWVLKIRWTDIINIITNMSLPFTIVPAEKRFLTPYVLIGEEYAISGFDTPHIKNHYKRTTKVIEYLNQNYELLNLNGVKKNHMRKAIERLIE